VTPIVLFSIQFSLSLVAYGLIAAWYVVPRLSERPREAALQPLLWVHAFRVAGAAVLAPVPSLPRCRSRFSGWSATET